MRHYFAAYDIGADRLWMRPRRRKRWQDALAVFRSIRRRYCAGERIHLVLDNLSSHKRREVVEWCGRNDVRLVFTATYTSWRNRIECHFAPLKQFVIDNSEYPDRAAIARAVQDYPAWRNRDAQNKDILKAQDSVRVPQKDTRLGPHGTAAASC